MGLEQHERTFLSTSWFSSFLYSSGNTRSLSSKLSHSFRTSAGAATRSWDDKNVFSGCCQIDENQSASTVVVLEAWIYEQAGALGHISLMQLIPKP